MKIGLLFWLLFAAAVVIYALGFDRPSFEWWQIFVLGQLFLLGWGIFGPPLRKVSKTGPPPMA